MRLYIGDRADCSRIKERGEIVDRIYAGIREQSRDMVVRFDCFYYFFFFFNMF